MSKEDSIRSLLHWVVSGLDELDEQSRKAEQACLATARQDEAQYPTYRPSSPLETKQELYNAPLDPAKVADENLAVAEGRKEEETDLSAGNMGMLSSAAPSETDEEGMRRARSVSLMIHPGIPDIQVSDCSSRNPYVGNMGHTRNDIIQ